jgi:hypothetical protein
LRMSRPASRLRRILHAVWLLPPPAFGHISADSALCLGLFSSPSYATVRLEEQVPILLPALSRLRDSYDGAAHH